MNENKCSSCKNWNGTIGSFKALCDKKNEFTHLQSGCLDAWEYRGKHIYSPMLINKRKEDRRVWNAR